MRAYLPVALRLLQPHRQSVHLLPLRLAARVQRRHALALRAELVQRRLQLRRFLARLPIQPALARLRVLHRLLQLAPQRRHLLRVLGVHEEIGALRLRERALVSCSVFLRKNL